jgi:2-polyprenyl-3-methyl-5-hydroxy-6-metoxy-1,4-benzoquinol methylase
MSSDQYYQFARSEMLAFLPDHYSKVLEVGCGAGSFIKSLNDGTESWGVEQDNTAAALAARHMHKVLMGSYQSVSEQLPDGYFDLIICNDVIEHIEHYDKFLQEIKSKLSNNGALLISVPNVRFRPNLLELLLRKDWRYRDAGILDRTHLRFFTRKSLCRTLQELDWQITKIQGINRYGNRTVSPKRFLSYLGQALLGRDTAYMQFAVLACKAEPR